MKTRAASRTEASADEIAFDAFISYKRDADGPLAAALQRALHRFAKPWNRQQSLRIARDTTTFSAAESLPEEIRRALNQSRCLIVIASPEAANAKWVNDEVSYWCAMRSGAPVMIALAAGTLAWNDALGDFEQAADFPLPSGLRGHFSAEPIWVDLRWVRAERVSGSWNSVGPSLTDGRFQDAVATLAARIRGVPKDVLYSQDLLQHRRTIRIVRLTAIVLGVLLVAALLLGGLAAWQRHVTLQQAEALNRQYYDASLRLVQREWEKTPVQTDRILELLAGTATNRARGFEWRYWNALLHRDLHSLRGHTSWVTSVGLSADGWRIVTGSWDTTGARGAGDPCVDGVPAAMSRALPSASRASPLEVGPVSVDEVVARDYP